MKVNKELRDLGLRVYKDQMIIKEENGVKVNQDEKEVLDILDKTFGHGTPTTNNIELFNQFLVQTAEVIAEPRVTTILGYLADVSVVPANTIKVYTLPKTVKPKFLYTAKGTGVDLVRIDGNETRKIATPESLTYGATYEITTFLADPIRAFRNAVNALADAKVDFYFTKVFEVMETAIANSEIPNANIKSVSNGTLADFQGLEQVMIRLTGGRPMFLGDMALINHFTNLIPTTQKDLLTDDMRTMLREELIPSKISKSVAVAYPNTWIDDKNSKVRFSVQQGFMFPGAYSGAKPFAITEFGTKRQYSTIDPETEQVNLKVVFEANVTLLNGRYLGYLKDTSVTL